MTRHAVVHVTLVSRRRGLRRPSAFSVAGARVWNALSADVTSAPSLLTFRKCLKLLLFFLTLLSWLVL